MSLSRRRRSESGFTIIELVLIIILLIVLTKMFVPRYSHDAILKHKVYATAHDLAADIRYARRLAVGGGLTGDSGIAYWITLSSEPAGSATNTWTVYEQGGAASPVKTVTALDNVQLRLVGAATDSFRFGADGDPSPIDAGVEVRDTWARYEWKVSVVKNTGRVKLSEM